jgi:hypothetical protein
MDAPTPGVKYESTSRNIKRGIYASFHNLVLLQSRQTGTEDLDRDDVYNFLWNLGDFTSNPPHRMRSDEDKWTMFIHCPRCQLEDHSESLFTLHIESNRITIATHAWCPHQQWTIAPKDPANNRVTQVLSSTLSMHPRDFGTNHPYRVFGRFLLANIVDSWKPGEEEKLRATCLSASSIYASTILKEFTITLESLIASHPGYYTIFVKDATPESPLLFRGKEVVQLTFIHPKALDVIQESQYLQLDASFHAVHPYVYSIPLGMIFNNALPLGIQLSPTEKEEHYTLFYDRLSKLIEKTLGPQFLNRLASQPILSDEGTGLAAFCRSKSLRQFNCYRHLLESIGASTPAGLITRRLLFTSSIAEYEVELQQAIADFHQIALRGKLTDRVIHKISDLFNLIYNYNTKLFSQADPDSADFAQAIWNRKDFRASTCSNHSERINRTCNKRTGTLTKPVRRLERVFEVLDDKFKSVQSKPNKQSKEKLKSLQKKAAELHLPDIAECPVENCEWHDIYSKRFGVDGFPCLHEALSRKLEEMVFPAIRPLYDSTDSSSVKVRTTDSEWPFRSYGESTALFSLSQSEEQGETNLNPTTIPISHEIQKFLIQLCHEILILRRIPQEMFTSTLMDLTAIWTKFKKEGLFNAVDIELLASFRAQIWFGEI